MGQRNPEADCLATALANRPTELDRKRVMPTIASPRTGAKIKARCRLPIQFLST